MRLCVLVARKTDRNRKCRKCLHNLAHMSLSELTDVLTALVFYDFLLSFMLTGCDGCIESDSKSLSRWRREAYRKI